MHTARNWIGRVVAVVLMGTLFVSLGAQPDREIDSLRQLLRHKPQTDTSCVADLSRIGFLFINRQPDSALHYHYLAYERSLEFDRPHLQAFAAYWLANVYFMKALSTEIFTYGHWALARAEVARDTQMMARCFSLLGLAYRRYGDKIQAIEYTSQALAIYQARSDQRKIGTELNNLASVYMDRDELDSARAYLEVALEIKRASNDKRGVVYCLGNIAMIYRRKGLYASAHSLLEQLLPMADSSRSPDLKVNIYEELTQIAIDTRDWPEATRCATIGLHMAEQLQIDESREALLTMHMQIARGQGNYKEALSWYEQAHALSDSIVARQNRSLIAELRLQREREAIKRLEQEVVYAQESRETAVITRQWTVALASVALLAMGIVIVVKIRAARRERKALEQISAQKEALAHLNLVKDRLFSIISHDLRSPLAQLAELLAITHEGRMTPESLANWSMAVSRRVDQLVPMLENLLEWAGYQMEGRRQLSLPTELSSLLHQTLDMFHVSAADKSISLELDLSGPLMVRTDPELIRTAVRNLVSNAIKYTPVGGMVSVQVAQVAGCLQIAVQDSGVGIATDQQTAFRTGGQLAQTNGLNGEHGAGIGLILVREMVRIHGGDIHLYSQPGRGSTFTLVLPEVPEA
ncbi:MAG: hypothetical protein OHK0039_47510 [Bacteroidia bacterium]